MYIGLGQGLLYALVAIGIFLTFRVMKYPDLTCEGSFAFGGALGMTLIVHGVPSIPAIIIAMIGGGVAGFLTGIIHTKLKINGIVVGILMTMALFSINLFVMQSPNISTGRENFIFYPIRQLFILMGMNPQYAQLTAFVFVGAVIVALIIVGLHFLYKTAFGLSIRATGSNENMSRANGINTDTAKIFALVISNAIIALAGALIAQHQSGADVRLGANALIMGLAGLVIGEVIAPKKSGLWIKFICVTAGSVIYFCIRSLILITGIATEAFNIVTAVITLAALCVPKLVKFIKSKKKPAFNGGGTPTLVVGDDYLAETVDTSEISGDTQASFLADSNEAVQAPVIDTVMAADPLVLTEEVQILEKPKTLRKTKKKSDADEGGKK